MQDIGSVLLALFGFSVFSTGIVLTKAGGAWLKWQGQKTGAYYKALAVWLLGFVAYNASAIPNAIASKALPPYIISAISGWGIVVIVIMSYLILKEKLFISDYVNATLMVAAIMALSLLNRSGAANEINQTAFYVMLALPLLLLVPLVFKGLAGRWRAILLAIFAGSAGGLALVIMNVVVKSLGYDLFRYFGTPYPYLYILVGVAQFVTLQMAMRFGSMIVVGPLQNALMILYPLACSYFIFGTSLGVLQLLMITLIVFSSVAILRKH
jgi:multidrug transporter EmrE-like cation transporter